MALALALSLALALTDVHCQADSIIVVEKETVFLQCVSAAANILPRAIFITGKGYPDVATRGFLNFLLQHPQTAHLHAFALMDADPHGVDILRVYKSGSANMAYTGTTLHCKKLHWLGLLHSDAIDARLRIPASAELPLTARAEAVCRRLLNNPTALSLVDTRCEAELRSMLARRTKFELEALNANGLGPVNFLKTKIEEWAIFNGVIFNVQQQPASNKRKRNRNRVVVEEIPIVEKDLNDID
eukprot:SAG31_NODE_377_length_16533_cov_99.867957_15_plen_243_part_00